MALHERKLVFPLPAAMLCFVAGYFVPTSHVVLGLVCLEPVAGLRHVVTVSVSSRVSVLLCLEKIVFSCACFIQHLD